MTCRSIVLPGLGALSLLAVAALAQPARAEPVPPTVSVTGEASVSVPPDMAEVDGGVTTEAKTAREASEANAKAMAEVIKALRAAGVADADLRTSRLSLQPQSAPARASGGPVQIVGYRASNRVTVRLRDVGKVAGIVDTLVAAGANEIGGINLMVTTASKLLDDARAEAVADARRKAEIYAKAAGITLGAPVSISEEGSAGPMPMRAFKAGMAATPVAPGEETLRIGVSIAYEIKPARP